MVLFVCNLTTIDFSWLDPLRGLVGESLIVDVSLTGELDEQSMVMDFSLVKKEIKKYLDASVDHALVLPLRNPRVTCTCCAERVDVMLFSDAGKVDCFVSGPAASFLPIDAASIETTELEKWLNKKIKEILPANIDDAAITLRHEEHAGYYYHYAHGLKKHAGNCQRIAHGHRSTIQIFINDKRDAYWEKYWAERWKNSYLMSENDVVAASQLSAKAQAVYHDKLLASAYTSSQGYFEILLSHEQVEILPDDTTVERIGCFIKQEIGRLNPQLGHVTVHAFEGVGKGARI
ncbi:6-carboxytetrahydropterin synthase [Candidatus Pantoea soli]|uniref:6-carboxy-5,6,7,8-tetrahydropterin synthase n=1 Tax=Candidatus Pantoea soli TaxID=3098669 RepID=A0A518XJL5_9GAMM|nr:6-carboxytetrahydropterin synthase [Pantoea soli]QDY44365.1 isocitrate dehydrogenase [Pantoea soli]